ncbi:hypothetical protein [Egicoccus sp. AB-alg2]|uniref:hypothetical protein n=1 Tax=Egicoccus sp. AB-alg2 TaxID=3242693 RepID=UPI00359CD54A
MGRRTHGMPAVVTAAMMTAAVVLALLASAGPADAAPTCPRPDLLPDDVVVLADGFRVEWTNPRLAAGDRIVMHRSADATWPRTPSDGLRIFDDGGNGVSGATRSVTVRGLPQDRSYGLAFFTLNPSCSQHGIGYFSGETARSSRVSLATSTEEIGVGDTVRLTVGVSGYDATEQRYLPLYDRPVTLHARRIGTEEWTRVATGNTGNLEPGSTNGRAVFNVTPTRNTEYQARFAGSGIFSPGTSASAAGTNFTSTAAVAGNRSPVRPVNVRPKVTIATSATRVSPGARATLSGKVSPKAAGQTVVVQRHDGSRWVEVARRKLSDTSQYRVHVYPPKGTWAYRVVRPAGAANARGVSPRVEIRAR